MVALERVKNKIIAKPKVWLITGVSGFIGSNLLEQLLKIEQKVIGLDNFSTGKRNNLNEVKKNVSEKQWKKFQFIEGDIRNIDVCREACKSVSYVLHQAALGSVSRSVNNPIETNETNVTGFLNMLIAAQERQVKRFIYAASSSTYGDHVSLPKREDRIGSPLSPYAVTKYANELYANVFNNIYGLESIGLRYFNVFGERQDPTGDYAAVIPKWIAAMINQKDVFINGDGKTSRDFCYVDNVIQANILAALTDDKTSINQVYNIALGSKTSLNELFVLIKSLLSELIIYYLLEPKYQEFRKGDVRHSLADIKKAKVCLVIRLFIILI